MIKQDMVLRPPKGKIPPIVRIVGEDTSEVVFVRLLGGKEILFVPIFKN